jgi:hypothetical protein
MRKLAAEEAPELSKEQLKTIKQEIKAVKPQTEEEKKIVELVGKPATRGQLLRSAGVGGVGGVATQVVGRAISGGAGGMYPWIGSKADMLSGKAVLSPRALARAASMGVIFGSAVPALKRHLDIEAAKRGKF